MVPVREPLVLVSQIERSGGTLLSRLFDDHPECHAHPRDIEIGYPRKTRDWPPIDLDHPESWFEMLHEAHVGKYRRKGQWSSKRVAERVPFLFSMQLQRTIFETWVANGNVSSERDVLDCYFTSYFNAWLDNHNLYTGPKKVVTGFVPRLTLDLVPDRAILRRLSGRNAHHHRTESLRLVRVVPGRPQRSRRRRRRTGAVASVGHGRPRGARATPRARRRRPVRGPRARHRDHDATHRRSDRNHHVSRAARSHVQRSADRCQLELRRSWNKVFSRSAPRPGERASTTPRATRIEALSDDLYERAQGIAQS